MSGTLLLDNQTYGSIRYSEQPINALVKNFSLPQELKKQKFNSLQDGGSWIVGSILTEVNKFYYIDTFSEAADFILPSIKEPGDSVWIFYDTTATIDFVSKESGNFPVFKVKSYKDKIMDHFEDLVIDVPFHRLQFTYHSENKGWLLC